MAISLSPTGSNLKLVTLFWLLGTGILATSNTLRAADTLTPGGAVSIDRSEQFLLSSEKMGDDYRIDIMLPIGYAWHPPISYSDRPRFFKPT